MLTFIVGADGKRSATDYDTLAFKLEVKCEKNHHAEKDESHPHRAFRHANGIRHVCHMLTTLQFIVGIFSGYHRGAKQYGLRITQSNLYTMIFSLPSFDMDK
jgi:hypothetical protein